MHTYIFITVTDNRNSPNNRCRYRGDGSTGHEWETFWVQFVSSAVFHYLFDDRRPAGRGVRGVCHLDLVVVAFFARRLVEAVVFDLTLRKRRTNIFIGRDEIVNTTYVRDNADAECVQVLDGSYLTRRQLRGFDQLVEGLLGYSSLGQHVQHDDPGLVAFGHRLVRQYRRDVFHVVFDLYARRVRAQCQFLFDLIQSVHGVIVRGRTVLHQVQVCAVRAQFFLILRERLDSVGKVARGNITVPENRRYAVVVHKRFQIGRQVSVIKY